MLDYVTIGTNDLKAASIFYDDLLGLLGATRIHSFARGIFYGQDRMELCVLTPFDGGEARPGNGAMVMLAAGSRATVDAVYGRAIALGGSDEGPPGVRGSGSFYIGYFRDPEGNKLAVGHRDK